MKKVQFTEAASSRWDGNERLIALLQAIHKTAN